MQIRKLTNEDSKEVCDLINGVFSKFIAPDFTKRAINDWLAKHTPAEQIERAKARDVFVAVINNKIVGMVEAKIVKRGKKNRISRLFVDGKYHKRGIGKALVAKIEDLRKKRGLKKLIINSSPFAVGFYEKMGYKKNGKIVREKGMVYQPMNKTFE